MLYKRKRFVRESFFFIVSYIFGLWLEAAQINDTQKKKHVLIYICIFNLKLIIFIFICISCMLD